jgi:heat shock protein HtpX
MWEQIRSNERRSLLVLAVMGMLLVATGAALGVMLTGDPEAALLGAGGALALWLLLWAITVTGGDQLLLGMAGAREIEKKDHPQLFNVVEEMTIAASLPKLPRVFLVDDPSPNAFAAGRDPAKAAVAVTTGLLALLDRDELQGVVAHEIGHIKNRDVKLMTTAGIMVGAVAMLADMGRRALWMGGARRSRSSSKEDNGAQAAMMVAAVVLMIVAPLLAQLVYFALSRRREYLADASGALFTRYPAGLASALEKLGGGSRTPLADTSSVTAPMYIVPPLRAHGHAAFALFSTHPPLAERVRILRTMAGAGYADYDQAFAKVHGGGIVGPRSKQAHGHVPTRTGSAPAGALGLAAAAAATGAAADPAAAGAAPATADRGGDAAYEARRRQANDAFLTASGYEVRTCAACGAVAKIPPSLRGKVKSCPRCSEPYAV